MIELNGHSLSIEDLWNIASYHAPCCLSTTSRITMKKSREFVERLAAEPRAIYGINTGFGPLSAHRVSSEDLEKHQINLLHHLAAGQGELFSPTETRAIMVARANALALGYSGIRNEVVDLLLDAVNRDILPEIPSEGSVGASGDLVPLAHMSRMLIGLGHVIVNDKRIPAEKALKESGLAPVVLKCKEGLALVNGISVMTGPSQC